MERYAYSLSLQRRFFDRSIWVGDRSMLADGRALLAVTGTSTAPGKQEFEVAPGNADFALERWAFRHHAPTTLGAPRAARGADVPSQSAQSSLQPERKAQGPARDYETRSLALRRGAARWPCSAGRPPRWHVWVGLIGPRLRLGARCASVTEATLQAQRFALAPPWPAVACGCAAGQATLARPPSPAPRAHEVPSHKRGALFSARRSQ